METLKIKKIYVIGFLAIFLVTIPFFMGIAHIMSELGISKYKRADQTKDILINEHINRAAVVEKDRWIDEFESYSIDSFPGNWKKNINGGAAKIVDARTSGFNSEGKALQIAIDDDMSIYSTYCHTAGSLIAYAGKTVLISFKAQFSMDPHETGNWIYFTFDIGYILQIGLSFQSNGDDLTFSFFTSFGFPPGPLHDICNIKPYEPHDFDVVIYNDGSVNTINVYVDNAKLYTTYAYDFTYDMYYISYMFIDFWETGNYKKLFLDDLYIGIAPIINQQYEENSYPTPIQYLYSPETLGRDYPIIDVKFHLLEFEETKLTLSLDLGYEYGPVELLLASFDLWTLFSDTRINDFEVGTSSVDTIATFWVDLNETYISVSIPFTRGPVNKYLLRNTELLDKGYDNYDLPRFRDKFGYIPDDFNTTKENSNLERTMEDLVVECESESTEFIPISEPDISFEYMEGKISLGFKGIIEASLKWTFSKFTYASMKLEVKWQNPVIGDSVVFDVYKPKVYNEDLRVPPYYVVQTGENIVAPVISDISYTDIPLVGNDIEFSCNLESEGTPPLNYTWIFSEDSTSYITDTPQISHEYTSPGDYTITVIVTDDNGRTDTHSIDITIIDQVSPPVISGISHTEPLYEDTLIEFSCDLESEGLAPLTFTWNFGDSSDIYVSTTPEITHSFSSAGEYVISVTVIDANCNCDSYSMVITINSIPPPVILGISYTKPLIVGRDIKFLCVLESEGRTPLTFTWNFGDGFKGYITDSPQISHSYRIAGRYIVSVKVTDANGNSDTMSIVIMVKNITPWPPWTPWTILTPVQI